MVQSRVGLRGTPDVKFGAEVWRAAKDSRGTRGVGAPEGRENCHGDLGKLFQ